MNGYALSRNFFDWSYENPDKIRPTHIALYFFAIEHCNRLGWKEKFGMPTQMAMDAIGVKNWRTYSGAFEELVKWGFFIIHQRSKNQYSATVIAIANNTKANTKALTKARQKHIQKQSSSTVVIDKHITIEQKNNKTNKQFIPPSLDDVKKYFEENGYTDDSAKKAWNYYEAGNWKDSKGNQVKNWKQKMQGVWFKDENKKQELKSNERKYVC